MIEPIPLEIDEVAEKIDIAIGLVGNQPLITAALAVLLGRYVAYEGGSAERLPEGLQIAWAMMRSAAIDEAVKLYGPKDGDE
jgi:hypothetical protein